MCEHFAHIFLVLTPGSVFFNLIYFFFLAGGGGGQMSIKMCALIRNNVLRLLVGAQIHDMDEISKKLVWTKHGRTPSPVWRAQSTAETSFNVSKGHRQLWWCCLLQAMTFSVYWGGVHCRAWSGRIHKSQLFYKSEALVHLKTGGIHPRSPRRGVCTSGGGVCLVHKL